MSHRPSIGLAMIVRDEAHNLPRLFDSISDCFDEVSITDTGSKDGTQEIAKSLGASVHHFKWCDDFAAARNASFEPLKTDFIMWLDGDDALENREGFIRWRDCAMEFADYWLATYHYALDGAGKPTCSFARERVLRREKGMRWRYFVHEGVIPASPYGSVRPDYITTWSVKHLRTAFDQEKDRSRNLRLFETRKNDLDPRMRYYYGKELFEGGQPMEAYRWLVDAVADPGLEMHDRILGIQYACYAAAGCNQFEKALQLAHQGMLLAPERAEFFVVAGDAYLKLGKMAEAVPMFAAAKSCRHQAVPVVGGMAQAIYADASAYGPYPRNQIARIRANLGDFQGAKIEAEESDRLYPNGETKSLISEIGRHMAALQPVSSPKPDDAIVLSCPPGGAYEWDADIAKIRGMGGSETAAIEMMHWIAKLSGKPVKIFNQRSAAATIDGVEYLPCNQAVGYFAAHRPFAHIAWRHNIKLTDAPTFLWAHDLITMGADNHGVYDRMLCLTPFHRDYAMARQGVPSEKILLTRNGIRPERFADGSINTGNPYLSQKIPGKFVFPSSPDRGLDRAMLVLDRVRVKHPNVELHVFYGFENLRKFGHGALADRLEAMIRERPWVKYHGFTQQDELIRHFKEAEIWLHPCDFIETSCITAMEMLCAGVYPVTRRLGGLRDTLRAAEETGLATLLDHDCVTELEFQAYTEAALRAIEERAWERVSCHAETFSWRSVAEEWLRTFLKDPGAYRAASAA